MSFDLYKKIYFWFIENGIPAVVFAQVFDIYLGALCTMLTAMVMEETLEKDV